MDDDAAFIKKLYGGVIPSMAAPAGLQFGHLESSAIAGRISLIDSRLQF
jgi:hypothetical protein